MVSRHIPEKMKKRIYQEANMTCPNCGERDVSTFEIHHIQPFSEVKKHEEKNLILLCSNCHASATAGQLSEIAVLRLKLELMTGSLTTSLKTEPAVSNVISLDSVRNQGVIANNVTVKGTLARVTQLPTSGSIACSLTHRNYIKYLIDRYHNFKVAEVGKSGMKYAVFYGSIKRKFGAKWDSIPLDRFSELSEYIQKRIDKTVLGKKHKSQGRRCYSSYEEYLKKNCS